MKNVVYEKLNIILSHDLPLTDTKACIVDKYQLYVLHDIFWEHESNSQIIYELKICFSQILTVRQIWSEFGIYHGSLVVMVCAKLRPDLIILHARVTHFISKYGLWTNKPFVNLLQTWVTGHQQAWGLRY